MRNLSYMQTKLTALKSGKPYVVKHPLPRSRPLNYGIGDGKWCIIEIYVGRKIDSIEILRSNIY